MLKIPIAQLPRLSVLGLGDLPCNNKRLLMLINVD